MSSRTSIWQKIENKKSKTFQISKALFALYVAKNIARIVLFYFIVLIYLRSFLNTV
jgi:hypothetical protein